MEPRIPPNSHDATVLPENHELRDPGFRALDTPGMSISIAYLFNWYPQPSLTALRREITAVEDLGLSPHRFTIRPFTGQLVDENDLAERRKTRALLDAGALRFLASIVKVAVSRPRAFARALSTAVRVGRVDERGLARTLVYFAESCLFLGWMDELGVDHVHTHYGTNGATVAMLCRLMGGPTYSFTMHGPEEFDSPRGNSLGEKIRHARFVVAICEFTRSQLYRWADYHDWSRIHVIHVGVSPLFLEHGPAPIPAALRLVNIGRIVEQKGQVILVEAAARLRDRGVEFELVIVGDGPMRTEIERLIGQHKLERRVRITGYLSNQGVRDELLAARALILPSFAEGLPAVFFESLALGRPVITTYIAGHPELIEAGVNGWLVPAGAVDPLVNAMAEVLKAEPAALEKMGQAGANRVAERHDFYKEARKLIDLFQAP